MPMLYKKSTMKQLTKDDIQTLVNKFGGPLQFCNETYL